jgi:malate dehydrogenase (oxaloacetate-decarboxylating)
VREMSRHVERPMIFPLSNPTRLHEAQPADITAWSDGKALISTGSPFPPVNHNGEMFEISECNNATAFPGIGLGAVLCRAKTVSDKMLVAATKALAEASPALRTKDVKKGLLPDIVDVWDVSKKIAAAVIRTAVEEGFATVEGIPTDKGEVEMEEWVGVQMWEPVYRELRKVKPEDATRAAKGELGVGRR